jgi:hypothetical protein
MILAASASLAMAIAAAQPALVGPADPPPARSAAAAPRTLRFSPEVLELGELTVGVPATARVTVTNAGSAPVAIESVKAGCGCTTVSAPPTGPVAPGASFTLDITLDPGTKGGIELSKAVHFTLSGGTVETMQVKGRVKAEDGTGTPGKKVVMFRLPAAASGGERHGATEAEQDALLVAIDRGLAGSARSESFRMRLHRESGMLFVHGSEEDVAAVRESVRLLPSPNLVRESAGTTAP